MVASPEALHHCYKGLDKHNKAIDDVLYKPHLLNFIWQDVPPKIGRVACVELFASEISKCWFIVVHAPAYNLLGQRKLRIIIVRNVRLFCSFLFFVRKG
jgi:hypothetical protein